MKLRPLGDSVILKYQEVEGEALTTLIVNKLLERVAKMAGGVAVTRIGAATETEMKEAKYRMEDALNATRAAELPRFIKFPILI
ncbi:MAG: hypothetical protein K2P02_01280 [Lachnospiraceae bacterium]|nr:hypothetical protein [Lachnospiraceae bacterium]